MYVCIYERSIAYKCVDGCIKIQQNLFIEGDSIVQKNCILMINYDTKGDQRN